jgi:hypothetical protein
MEIRDYVQIGSLLLTALSVTLAYLAFSRSRVMQQITELRSSLLAAWAATEELDDILSTSSAVNVGNSIVKEIKNSLGDEVPLEDLKKYFEEIKYRNIITSAVVQGYRGTNISHEIEKQKAILNKGAIACQSLYPNTSNCIKDCAYFLTTTVQSPFHTSHIMQMFTFDANLKAVMKSLDDYDTIATAYADLADSIRGSVQQIMVDAAQDSFNHVNEILVTIVRSFLAKSDGELLKLSKMDRRLKIQSFRLLDAGSRLSRIDGYVSETGPIFGNIEHDNMVKMVTKMEQRLAEDNKNLQTKPNM